MPNLIFELGCEEMPASAVERATQELLGTITNFLTESGINAIETTAFGTPRRLIIGINGLPNFQPERSEEIRGPRKQAAFDLEGNATKALEGFCKGQGISINSVVIKDDYVWIYKVIPGKAMRDLLAEILPESIRRLKFDKTMRWGNEKARFVRPIRWVMAKLDSDVIDFEIFGTRADRFSQGHRFLAPNQFEPQDINHFIKALRDHFVEPDFEIRKQLILNQAKEVCTGEPILTSDLLNENANLVEWPMAHEGSFSPEFLNLPEAVLVTAMAKHQRFFPVKNSVGKLENKFIAIRNNGKEENVRAGNEWVLNARFNDARFFYHEDQKRTLSDFLADTGEMLFQDKLGTVRERADRLAILTSDIYLLIGGTEHEDAKRAGLYAKADLSTGLVSELSSLQGVIGGEYARREGFSELVAQAISQQYSLPDELNDSTRLGIALLMADQLDKLAGFLGLGLAPKGSSDPFGLRRAAGLLIQAAWLTNVSLSFDSLLKSAIANYKTTVEDLSLSTAEAIIAEIFVGRYEALLPQYDHDVLAAASLSGQWRSICDPVKFLNRVTALQKSKLQPEIVQTFTRPLNILSAARQKGELSFVDVKPAELTPVGQKLYTAVQTQSDLAQAIHEFFESTMINDEDLTVRQRNYSLMKLVEDELLKVGDYSKLVFE